ncbi:type II toxin-antitoxin system prevent-host-death family antitoxin [Geminocystis sp. GBBB08]|uniref:type II toxin-antitoxin system Phd/YefM family antitoxin n=1 Tax=Geminocystis sp. GBBB08 TaxID=2604140 RepID=UPI0027E2FC09|nr:type II toxin-antitoxin system prevent-host-death family antitoxin [Geminocystis sp. GBBB08]MBL1208713.1 type II toxin-antitoxin system Phd/YefM family antitoxin [Geminocystis sp. GBBB08]
MKSLTASEAKNRFGMLLDWARREPVIIEKQGRQVAILLSVEEYERLLMTNQSSSNLDKQDLSLEERLAILRLPEEERSQILLESADKMLSHYQNNSEWQELSGGDFVEYKEKYTQKRRNLVS